MLSFKSHSQRIRAAVGLLCCAWLLRAGAADLAWEIFAVERGPVGAVASIVPSYLRCEYLVDPLGIAVAQPRLSWILEPVSPGARDEAQTAYQILAATRPEILATDRGDLWNTGQVKSDESLHVIYAGLPLRSTMSVYWKVRVWDKEGRVSAWSPPARWTMGLLALSDWQAKWISDSTPLPERVFAHNGYLSEFAAAPDETKWVAIDLGESATLDAVRLWPARPFDLPDTPGFLFPLRFQIDISDRADFATYTTVVDFTKEDVPNPGIKAPVYSFAPRKGRYVRLTVTRMRPRDADNFGLALAEMEVLSGDRNLALLKNVSASDANETGAWSMARLVDGDTVSHPAAGMEARPAPLLRKTFAVNGRIARAMAYVTALGLYELRINGQRVGDHILAPEWTDYNQRVQYQTYNVTSLLRSGANSVGAVLGEGWYAGRIGLADSIPNTPPRGIYGRQPRLLLRLELEFDDGHKEAVVSDGTWQSTMEGPIRSSDIFDGEVYDARREMPGWDTPGFVASGWSPVDVLDRIDAELVSQPNEPIRVVKELRPVRLSEPRPGRFVFDLGQNMVGWCRIRLRGPAGTTVTLRHAEVLNDDGTIYTANLGGAPQTDRVTLRGSGEEEFEPHFTYHGFRYVEVSGLPTRPAIDALVGRVFHSAASETLTFESSSPLLNRLVENIIWTQRANMQSTPTDCPQRDERLGYTGDIQVFSQTACFNMDMASFFTKWTADVRDAQADDGRYPDFAPNPYDSNIRLSGTPAWGDAGVVVPWRVYTNYGDRWILGEQIDSAMRWVEYVRVNNPDLVWRRARNDDFGDWLNGDQLILDGWPTTGAEVPKEVLATAFFAHSTEILAKMAAELGLDERAAQYTALFEGIKAAFNREFVQRNGRITGDTQAGYALALNFNLLPDELRPMAARYMVEGIRRYNGHLSTGFMSTVRLMLELTRNGYNEEAYHLINNRTVPSWGYMIDNGATTIWERWDGYVRGRGFQDPDMNSFNHYGFGSVGEWMVRVILGINPDEKNPAYKRFILRPQPGGGLDYARGEYDSIRGKITSAWRKEGNRLTLDITIPPNTSATVYVPTNNVSSVTESGRPADQAPGVTFLRMEDGAAVFQVASGRYQFAAEV